MFLLFCEFNFLVLFIFRLGVRLLIRTREKRFALPHSVIDYRVRLLLVRIAEKRYNFRISIMFESLFASVSAMRF